MCENYCPCSIQVPAVPIDQPCKCIFRKCIGKEFPSVQKLMLHLRNDHIGQGIDCIFETCSNKFTNSNALRNHFYQKHIKVGSCSLKGVHKLVNDPISKTISDHEDSVESEVRSDLEIPQLYDDATDDNDEEEDDEEIEDEEEDHFLMSYCDFLNRLSNFQFIPQSTIKVIAEQYLKNYTKSNEVKSASLRESLEKIPGITEAEISRVLKEYQEKDPFLDAQSQLDTEYKRNLFIKDKFSYVQPQEIILNPDQVKNKVAPKACIHYVSVIETFKNLVEDPSFNEMMEHNNPHNSSDTFKDVKDGELYKKNKYFMQNPEAFTMILYSDAIELVNPLGAGRGKHKVIQVGVETLRCIIPAVNCAGSFV